MISGRAQDLRPYLVLEFTHNWSTTPAYLCLAGLERWPLVRINPVKNLGRMDYCPLRACQSQSEWCPERGAGLPGMNCPSATSFYKETLTLGRDAGVWVVGEGSAGRDFGGGDGGAGWVVGERNTGRPRPEGRRAHTHRGPEGPHARKRRLLGPCGPGTGTCEPSLPRRSLPGGSERRGERARPNEERGQHLRQGSPLGSRRPRSTCGVRDVSGTCPAGVRVGPPKPGR